MKVTVADKEKSQKELSIEIPANVFKEEFDKEFNRVAKNIKVAGFRAGKAPKEVIMKEKGHAIRVQTLEHVINEAVERIRDGSIAGVIYDPASASLRSAG